MEILEAFDLTGSFRDASELAGCSHHTVAVWVARRDAGALPGDGPQRRVRMVDAFLPKIVVGNEDADAAVAHVVSIGERGLVLLRILPGPAEAHLTLLEPRPSQAR